MTNTILLRRSSTASAIPTTGVMTLGEVAVNTYDGRMFMLQNNGTVSIKEIGAVYTVAGRTGNVTLSVADVAGAAPLVSPSFTGAPTAPTATGNDSSTNIANTLFVQGLVNGALVLSVAGGTNVTLTATQAGNAVFVFTGTLTTNTTVFFPNAAKTFVVANRTTGAYTLTISTLSGTGVVVDQGYNAELVSDGTNVIFAHTD